MSGPTLRNLPSSLRDDRYELVHALGEGGMATVWLARDRDLGVDRAIKVLHPEPTRRRSLRRRLKAEARAMARLSHPNILRILDVGAEGDFDYVVMELAQGGSLQDKLDDGGPMATNLAIAYTVQVLSALAAAHAAGIVHRDVKPQNILLDVAGRALLADFGIALLADDDNDRKTKAGVAMGSLAFMPPEQRVDARSVGPAADLYATGATLYTLLTSSNPVDLFSAGPSSPRWLGVPRPVADVIRRSTSVDPQERFADAGQMAEVLINVAQALEQSALSLPGESGPAFPLPSAVFTTGASTMSPTAAPRTLSTAEGQTGGGGRTTHPDTLSPEGGADESSWQPHPPNRARLPDLQTSGHDTGDDTIVGATAEAISRLSALSSAKVSGPTLVDFEMDALGDEDDGIGYIDDLDGPGLSLASPGLDGALQGRSLPGTAGAPPDPTVAAGAAVLQGDQRSGVLKAGAATPWWLAAGLLAVTATIFFATLLAALQIQAPAPPPATAVLDPGTEQEGAPQGASEVTTAVGNPAGPDAPNTTSPTEAEVTGSDVNEVNVTEGDASARATTASAPTSKPSTPETTAASGKPSDDRPSSQREAGTAEVTADHSPAPSGVSPASSRAPFGQWKGSSGGRVMRVTLSGTDNAVSGVVSVSFGANTSTSKVTGRWDPAEESLSLSDIDDRPDAGTYRLALTDSGQRLSGTFERNVGGLTTLSLKRQK